MLILQSSAEATDARFLSRRAAVKIAEVASGSVSGIAEAQSNRTFTDIVAEVVEPTENLTPTVLTEVVAMNITKATSNATDGSHLTISIGNATDIAAREASRARLNMSDLPFGADVTESSTMNYTQEDNTSLGDPNTSSDSRSTGHVRDTSTARHNMSGVHVGLELTVVKSTTPHSAKKSNFTYQGDAALEERKPMSYNNQHFVHISDADEQDFQSMDGFPASLLHSARYLLFGCAAAGVALVWALWYFGQWRDTRHVIAWKMSADPRTPKRLGRSQSAEQTVEVQLFP